MIYRIAGVRLLALVVASMAASSYCFAAEGRATRYVRFEANDTVDSIPVPVLVPEDFRNINIERGSELAMIVHRRGVEVRLLTEPPAGQRRGGRGEPEENREQASARNHTRPDP